MKSYFVTIASRTNEDYVLKVCHYFYNTALSKKQVVMRLLDVGWDVVEWANGVKQNSNVMEEKPLI